MQLLYLISVWLHILVATVWVGGLFFLVLVLVPWLRRGGAADAGTFLKETGERFRLVGWICFVILLATGTLNLWVRGVRPGHFIDSAWWGSAFGAAVGFKLAVFVLVLLVSAVHDFGVGPRATIAIQKDPTSPDTARLRRTASLLGRLNGVLALLLLALGVVLVRGWPW